MPNVNAVVVRAGAKSMHSQWLRPAEPEFDLLVVSYEPVPALYGHANVFEFLIPGRKVAGWNEFFVSHSYLLDRYEYIALIDNDLECTSEIINTLFHIGREKKLAMWQPSLTWDSYFTYAVFLRNPIFQLRYVNFIEMMCPFFSSDHMKRSLPLFSLGYETGIDRLWCRLGENPAYKYAVIDQVSVKHMEPVGGKASLQGFIGDRSDYQVEIDEMEERFGVFFLGPVAYAGVLKNGRLLRGRLTMAVLSVVIAVGFIYTPIRRWFFKSVTDHWRHILTRPIDNEFLPLSGA